MCGPAAVDGLGGAGDAGGGVGAQEGGQGGHVGGLEQLFARGGGEHDLLDNLLARDVVLARQVVDLSVDQRRPHVARTDRVACDALVACFHGDRLGQPEQSVLGRHVRRLVRRGDQAVNRRNIDDATPAARVHVRNGVLRQQKRTDQQDANQLLPALFGELLDWRDMLDTGVVDQDVDAAPLALGPVDQRPTLFAGGHVGPLEDRSRQAGGERLALLFFEIRDKHARAVIGQVLGNCPTDAAGGAGHQRRLAREIDRHRHIQLSSVELENASCHWLRKSLSSWSGGRRGTCAGCGQSRPTAPAGLYPASPRSRKTAAIWPPGPFGSTSCARACRSVGPVSRAWTWLKPRFSSRPRWAIAPAWSFSAIASRTSVRRSTWSEMSCSPSRASGSLPSVWR